MPANTPSLFTIGHSNHAWSEFARLLQLHDVTAIVDVRSRPSSRWRHFNRAELEPALNAAGIAYIFLGDELGARRVEPECYVDGQAVYEKVAMLPLFRKGLERLRESLEKHHLALLCAEKEPLDCHRTILICRHLRGGDIGIRHILAGGELEDHAATEKRLVERMQRARSLFDQELSDDELLAGAYERRGREIAYRAKEDSRTK